MTEAHSAAYGAALLRITLGTAALAHGLVLKVMTFGVAGTVGFFESLGIPAIAAYAVIFGEIAGGLALITGVYHRLAAVLMIPILIGATIQHAGNGWVFSNAGGGWEFPAMWTVLLAVSALVGPGALALRLPFLPELPLPKAFAR